MSAFSDIKASDVMLLAIALTTAWNTAKAQARDRVLKQVKDTGEATHLLSNSAMGEQKKLNVEFAEKLAIQAHRMALITKEDGDIAAAAAADLVVDAQKAIYQTHLIQQAKVDAKEIGQ